MYGRHSFGCGLSNPWQVLADLGRFLPFSTLWKDPNIIRNVARGRFGGTWGCDSFYKLGRVNVRGCVGAVIDLYGFWHVLGVSWQFLAYSTRN